MLRNRISLLTLTLLAACARPVADFSYTAERETAPANVAFSNQSKNSTSYEWDFGDGNRSNEESPSHLYRSSGNYIVTLQATKGTKSKVTEKKVWIGQPLECLVEIETDFGSMLVELSNATPQHRDNFIKLAEEGYFDNLLFHRVIPDFMIQGGDPQSRGASPTQALGSGGPGYTIPAEFVDSLIHQKGALAAARQGDQVNPEKKSSGSQFYIVQGKPLSDEEIDRIETRKGIRYSPDQRRIYRTQGGTPFLDREYTVFGQVIEGLEVIDKIAAVTTGQGDRPRKDIRMKVQVIK